MAVAMISALLTDGDAAFLRVNNRVPPHALQAGEVAGAVNQRFERGAAGLLAAQRTLAGQHLGKGDAFFFRFMRTHWAWDQITDGINAGNVGLKMRIDLNKTALVFRNAELFKS